MKVPFVKDKETKAKERLAKERAHYGSKLTFSTAEVEQQLKEKRNGKSST